MRDGLVPSRVRISYPPPASSGGCGGRLHAQGVHRPTGFRLGIDFGTTHTVATLADIVARVVADHIDDARLDGLHRIGVDEISYKRGHRYLTAPRPGPSR